MEAKYSSAHDEQNYLVKIVETGISHWPAAVISIALLFSTYTLRNYSKVVPNSELPRIGSPDLISRWKSFLGPDSWELYKDGYKKFNNGAFKITDANKRDRIVLPHTFLPELAKYPDEIVSHTDVHLEDTQAQYILPDVGNPVFRRLLLSHMTPAMARLTPVLREELVEVMTSELPDSLEWVETTIHEKLWRIVSFSTGRIFSGPECCREPAYLQGAMNYSLDMGAASRAIRKIPRLLRPILAPRLPTTKRVRQHLQGYAEILGPVIEARKQEAVDKGTDYKKPEDLTQWMIDTVDHVGEKEILHMAFEQSIISFAGVNAEVQFIGHALYTFAAYPELGPILLEDVNQALEESSGEWTNAALQNMKKLDSFLKEVGRYEPFTAFSFARQVMSPITLSNGMYLPKNTIIEVDWYGVSRDENIYPEPDKFDAMRFYKLRTNNKDFLDVPDYTYHFTNSSPTYLTWNFGRHSCPGRYFAGNHIKLIFATLLLNYEIRNAAGVEGRAKNLRAVGQQCTNPKGKIQIRRKATI